MTPSTGSTLDPILMIFDDADGNLVTYNNDRFSGNPASGLTFQRTPGHTYKLVVGALNGATTGYFRLGLANVLPPLYIGSLSGTTTTRTTSTSLTTTALTTSSSLLIRAGTGEEDRVLPQAAVVAVARLPAKPVARAAQGRLDAKVVDRLMVSLGTELAGGLDSDELPMMAGWVGWGIRAGQPAGISIL